MSAKCRKLLPLLYDYYSHLSKSNPKKWSGPTPYSPARLIYPAGLKQKEIEASILVFSTTISVVSLISRPCLFPSPRHAYEVPLFPSTNNEVCPGLFVECTLLPHLHLSFFHSLRLLHAPHHVFHQAFHQLDRCEDGTVHVWSSLPTGGIRPCWCMSSPCANHLLTDLCRKKNERARNF